MKKIFLLSISMMFASILFAQRVQVGGFVDFDVIIGNRPPKPSEAQLMRMEEAKHPNVVKAMHAIEVSMRDLHAAPDDFGGHKAQAEADLHQAWISLRKALYFRIYEDRR